MYHAFAKEYPVGTQDLNTELEIFPVSSANSQKGTMVYAIWDTGAEQTVITHSLMAKLNLVPIESETVFGLNSKQVVDIVVVTIKLPNGLFIPDIRVFVCDIPSPIDMLIGMDIIQRGDFHISNAKSRTLFSFVIPSFPTPFSLVGEADRLNSQKDQKIN